MSKWEILFGAGDVAIYNGLKKIFHVFPEEAEIVVKILNDLEDELARCKSEREKYLNNTSDLSLEVMRLRQEIRNRLSDENKALARVGELTSELARCKSERLGAEEILDECVLQFEHLNQLFAETGTTNSLLVRITAFRASQQTQEGKG